MVYLLRMVHYNILRLQVIYVLYMYIERSMYAGYFCSKKLINVEIKYSFSFTTYARRPCVLYKLQWLLAEIAHQGCILKVLPQLPFVLKVIHILSTKNYILWITQYTQITFCPYKWWCRFLYIKLKTSQWCWSLEWCHITIKEAVQKLNQNETSLQLWITGPLCGEFTAYISHQWIPCINGQQSGKYFHVRISSWCRELYNPGFIRS